MDTLSEAYLERLATFENFSKYKVQLKFGANSIGRLPSNDIVVSSGYASRNHCVINVNGLHRVTVKLNKTQNGIYVNGIQHTQGDIELQMGDTIGIGCDTSSIEPSDTQYFIFTLLRNATVSSVNSHTNSNAQPNGDTKQKNVLADGSTTSTIHPDKFDEIQQQQQNPSNPTNTGTSTSSTLNAKHVANERQANTSMPVNNISGNAFKGHGDQKATGRKGDCTSGRKYNSRIVTNNASNLQTSSASTSDKNPIGKHSSLDGNQSALVATSAAKMPNTAKANAAVNQEALAVTKVAVQKPTSAKVDKRPTPPTRQLTPEYGSEWDTDGEETLKQQREMQRKRKTAKVKASKDVEQLFSSDDSDFETSNAAKTKRKKSIKGKTTVSKVDKRPASVATDVPINATADDVIVLSDDDGNEQSSAIEIPRKPSLSNKPPITGVDLSAAISKAMGKDRSSSTDRQTLPAMFDKTRNDRKRKSGPTSIVQVAPNETATSDDSHFETSNAAKTKRKKGSKGKAAATAENSDEYRAGIRTTHNEVKFLSNKLTKKSSKFICPYVNQQKRKCDTEFTTFTALQKHFVDMHKKQRNDVQKPADTAPNNWRRIHNSNHRFRMRTVKMKLCSLLVGGRSVVHNNRLRLGLVEKDQQQPPATPLQNMENEMAREVYELLEEQAKELSKLAILFSHLVYFKVYKLLETNDCNAIDETFRQNINFNLVLLKFKEFKRATTNSAMSNSKKVPAMSNSKKVPKGENNSFEFIDDNGFFEMCKQYAINTRFEEWSQNAWTHISQTFASNFETNIKTHLYTRLRNWMRFKLSDGKKRKDVRGKENRKDLSEKVYHTMKFLFDSGKSTQPKMVQHNLITELQKICKFPDFNKSGRSYFSRLYLDFKEEEEDDDDDGKAKKVSKSKAKKRKGPVKRRKGKQTKTQCNGQRLIWLQLVPGMVRLQRWIYETKLAREEQLIAAGILTKKMKKKRKRRRRKTPRKDESHQPQSSSNANQPKQPRATKRKRKRTRARNQIEDDEAVHHAKLKNFIVVPQHDFNMKHFAIDCKSLFDVVKNLKAFTRTGKGLYTQNEFVDLVADPENTNSKTVNPFWYFLFNLKKLETARKKFGGRITTNSSDVSVQLCRIKYGKHMTKEQVIEAANNAKRKRSDAKSESDSDSESESDEDEETGTNEKTDPNTVRLLQRMATNLENIRMSGVDLGIRNVAATVTRTWHRSANSHEIHESNVIHKSKDYHYEAGFNKRQRRRRKIVGSFDRAYQNDRQEQGEEPSQRSPDYMKYLRSRLKWFNRGTDAYMQRTINNMHFDKYRDTQRQMTKMAKEIVGEASVHGSKAQRQPSNDKICNVVFIGDCSTPANSAVKGHRRSPGDKPISRYIRQRPNTIVIKQDEFRTTKNCSRCFQELESVENSKERLKICSKLCKPAEYSTPATEISTYTNKKVIRQQMLQITLQNPKPTQIERKRRVPMQRSERWSQSDRIRMEHRQSLKSTSYKHDPSNGKVNALWNRDANAARNIMYLGLCRYGKFVNESFQQSTKNIAFSRPKRPE